jgi:hypothetical protein
MDSAYNLARPNDTIFGKGKKGKVVSYDELAADPKTPALCYREAVS